MFAIIHAAVVSAILVTAAMLWRYGAGLPMGFGRLNARLVAGLTATSGALLAVAALVAQLKLGYALNLPWAEVDPMLRGLVIIGVPIACCNLATMAILRGLAALPGGIESLDLGVEEAAPATPPAKHLGQRMAERLGTFLRVTAVLWIVSSQGPTEHGAQWVVSILLLLTVLIDGALMFAEPAADAAARTSMMKGAVALVAAYLVYGHLADGAHAWTLRWSILNPATLLVFSLIAHFALRLAAKLGAPARGT